MLGGEARVGPRTKFLSENYFLVGESGVLVSGGIRFWGERLSADAGVGTIIGGDATESVSSPW
jgi:energy-converting hydrogenase Eha subunit B